MNIAINPGWFFPWNRVELNLFLLNLAILFPDSHELTPPIYFYLISLIYFYLINPSYLCLVTQLCLTLCNPMDYIAH